jgi:centriolar protein POC1
MSGSTTFQVTKEAELRGHRQAIYALSPSMSKGHLFSAGADGVVAEWDLETLEARQVLQAPCAIYCLQLQKETGLLFMGLQNGEIAVADMRQNIMLKRLQVHSSGVFDIQFDPGGKNFWASSKDGTVSVWDTGTLVCLQRIRISAHSIRTLSIHPSTGLVAMGCSDNHIYLFDNQASPLSAWTAHAPSVFRVLWEQGPKGALYSTGRDALIRSWDLSSQSGLPVSAVPAHLYAINDLIWMGEGPYLVSGSMDKSIKVWDRDLNLLKVVNFEKNGCHWNGVNRLLWLGNRLFSCGDDRIIMQWKFEIG